MVYIGIDPGKNGGYAILVRPFISTQPMDEKIFVREMHEISKAYPSENIRCCLEKVGAMPGQGVTSMFSFGKNAGYIEGVLTALGIRYQLVVPRRWKAEFGLTGSKADSIEVCRRLFPGVSLRASERCRKDSDGMAEALLMAEFARRKL